MRSRMTAAEVVTTLATMDDRHAANLAELCVSHGAREVKRRVGPDEDHMVYHFADGSLIYHMGPIWDTNDWSSEFPPLVDSP
jgi:hypothetical protein